MILKSKKFDFKITLTRGLILYQRIRQNLVEHSYIYVERNVKIKSKWQHYHWKKKKWFQRKLDVFLLLILERADDIHLILPSFYKRLESKILVWHVVSLYVWFFFFASCAEVTKVKHFLLYHSCPPLFLLTTLYIFSFLDFFNACSMWVNIWTSGNTQVFNAEED